MIQHLKRIIKNNINVLTGKPIVGQGEFAKRIQHRHKTFWEDPEGRELKYNLISPKDTIEAIKDATYWQRRLSNKFNSREFAKKLGCQVPDLYWKGRDIQNINFNLLPEQFVIRPTAGYGCNLVFLMNGSLNMMDKRSYTSKELLDNMQGALAQDPDLEFLIEEFVRTENGEYRIPKDYKFYTFNGEIARIEVINRLGPNEGSTSLYTPDWKQVENLAVKYATSPYEEPPRCLDELIELAKKISKAYEIFVRIDFYATDKGPVFGEFTPTPARGKVFTSSAEKMFISYWDKYCKNMI